MSVKIFPVDELRRTPFDVASLNEFEERLEAAIAHLPPIYREVSWSSALNNFAPWMQPHFAVLVQNRCGSA